MASKPRTNLSPKELAEAIGVSESSIKRWVDDGLLVAERTAGGHRRIPIAEAARFIRDQQHELKRPELLGFEHALPWSEDPEALDELFHKAIESGQTDKAIGMVVGLYLQGHSPFRLCDHPIHAGYKKVRDGCPHPNEKCFVLHRSRDICRQVLGAMRSLMAPPAQDALHAAGGDVGYNIDCLPTHLAATAFAALGHRVTDLAEDVPVEILLGTLKNHRPDLLWISASGGRKVKRKHLDRILEKVSEANPDGRTQIVLLGDAFNERMARHTPHAIHVGSTSELAAYAEGMKKVH
ncbi:MAG: MerR family DNA-binding transcriptional regulator [Phycisphaeraceae bacterium]|nr:MerR family DNA-binding transcriptional regulator [Phycisphaeraceae bacterium]